MRPVVFLIDCSVTSNLSARVDVDDHKNTAMNNNEVFITENVDQEEAMYENTILGIFWIFLSIR